MTNEIETAPRLLNSKNAAKYLAISERKLFSMGQGGIIPVIKMGRSVRFDFQDLDKLIFQAKTECNTSG